MEKEKDDGNIDDLSDDSSADDLSVSDCGEADFPELVGNEVRKECGYSLERVQKFLSSMKGKRNVVVMVSHDA